MLSRLVTKEFIKLNAVCSDWRDAINKGAEILLKKDVIEERYIEKILENFETMGSYMVIAPGIVLSHARPEDGVKKVCMSIMTLKDSVEFGSELNDPVKLVITFGAENSESHLSALAQLMELFLNSEDLVKIVQAVSVEEVLQIINKYS